MDGIPGMQGGGWKGELESQVPKNVVSKRVVLADVPLYRHFFQFLHLGSFTFWQFGAVSLAKEGSPRPSALPELRFAVH